MTWRIIEGIDRSGKSTVAETYKKQGYEVYHMSAPDKKYSQPGYTGPSYLDDCIEIYQHFDGKDVVFDRSTYGEYIWPDVYGRKPQLSLEDLEILREFEANNDTKYTLMQDTDFDAHWKRCKDNNEPLNRNQFNIATALYDKLAGRFNFEKTSLAIFKDSHKMVEQSRTTGDTGHLVQVKNSEMNRSTSPSERDSIHVHKLKEANAIDSILSARILKKKGDAFDRIESDIRSFLQTKLASLLGNNNADNNFSKEEVFILKQYVSALKRKLEDKDGKKLR